MDLAHESRRGFFMTVCADCLEYKPTSDFKRSNGKAGTRCRACIAAWRQTTKPRDYYHSPEYKRIQRERKAEREGRTDYVPGQGKKAGLLSQQRAALRRPDEIANTTWREIEVLNAKQAWSYWLNSLAPSWWREARKAVLAIKKNRAGNPAYRATWRAARQARRARKLNQADGTLSNAEVARMIRDAKDCMWCGVALTLPVHKRYEPTMATIEHIVPLCQGGLHSKANVGVACARCNYTRAKKAA